MPCHLIDNIEFLPCRMIFKDENGNPLYTFDLATTIAIVQSDGSIIIRDDKTGLTLNEDNANTLGITAEIINTAGDECRSGRAANLTDFELTCVAENDNLYYIDLDEMPPVIYDFNGNDVTGTVTPIQCYDEQPKIITECWESTTDETVRYSKVICFFPSNPTGTLSVFWILNDTIVPPPADVQPCEFEICLPTIQLFTLDNVPATILPYNVISVVKPACCTVGITIGSSSVVIPANFTSWTPEKMDCCVSDFDFTIWDESSPIGSTLCTEPEKIIITLQNTGDCNG